jgi:hypothetical protein
MPQCPKCRKEMTLQWDAASSGGEWLECMVCDLKILFTVVNGECRIAVGQCVRAHCPNRVLEVERAA